MLLLMVTLLILLITSRLTMSAEGKKPGKKVDGKKFEKRNGEINELWKNGEKNGFPKKKKLLKPGRTTSDENTKGFTTKRGVKKKPRAVNKGRLKKTGANASPRSAGGKSQKPGTKMLPPGVHTKEDVVQTQPSADGLQKPGRHR
jgi:hypothetical protein